MEREPQESKRRHKLLPREIAAKLPVTTVDEEGNTVPEDPTVWLKLFCPYSNWTWYATEYDPETGIFFGLVHGFEEELGSFSFHELAEAQFNAFGCMVPAVERDCHWRPRPLSECRSK